MGAGGFRIQPNSLIVLFARIVESTGEIVLLSKMVVGNRVFGRGFHDRFQVRNVLRLEDVIAEPGAGPEPEGKSDQCNADNKDERASVRALVWRCASDSVIPLLSCDSGRRVHLHYITS